MKTHKQVKVKGIRPNGTKFKFQCDEQIADFCKQLNELGYETLYSCQNDSDNNRKKSPYFMIKFPEKRDDLLKFIQIVRKKYKKRYVQISYNLCNHGFTTRVLLNDKNNPPECINDKIYPYQVLKYLFLDDYKLAKQFI